MILKQNNRILICKKKLKKIKMIMLIGEKLNENLTMP